MYFGFKNAGECRQGLAAGLEFRFAGTFSGEKTGLGKRNCFRGRFLFRTFGTTTDQKKQNQQQGECRSHGSPHSIASAFTKRSSCTI